MFKMISKLAFVVWILAVCSPVWGQSDLATKEKSEVVESIGELLDNCYIYPAKAAEISADLQQKLKSGEYAKVSEAKAFAIALTEDIFEASGDLHFHVLVDADWLKEQHANDAKKSELAEAEKRRLKQNNFGFKDVRILDGNIGYLNLTSFEDPEYAHDKLAAVMQFLHDTDALVIDLRHNNGGALEMAQLLSSFLFKSEPPQLLFDYYYNSDGKRIERKQWVLPSVPGKRIPSKPVFLLASSTSFSSAEWFCYSLKNLKRATVVGEQTAGGAHPVQRKAINSRFVIQIPIGEVKDSVNHDDFEGVGVTPDIAVVAKDALHVAHREALNRLIRLNPKYEDPLSWHLATIAARINPIFLDATTIDSIIGEYDGRTIALENGTLFYSWGERQKIRLTPLSKTLLALDGIDDFRFRVVSKNGKTTGIERVFSDGSKRFHKKTGQGDSASNEN